LAVVPGVVQQVGEQFVALQRHLGDQLLAAREMAIGRGGRDPASFAASAMVKPCGPFSAIRSSVASISAWRRLPW
jgi:hypothetical protein